MELSRGFFRFTNRKPEIFLGESGVFQSGYRLEFRAFGVGKNLVDVEQQAHFVLRFADSEQVIDVDFGAERRSVFDFGFGNIENFGNLIDDHADFRAVRFDDDNAGFR